MGTSFSSTDYAFNANISLPANAALGIFSAQSYSTTYGTGGDDTAAVQAALNAATAAGGAVAFLPPPTSGYVNISSTLVLGNNGTCLVGASPSVKIKVKAGSNLDWAISTAVETSVDYRTNFVVNTHAVTLGGNTYNLYNAASPASLSTGGGIYNVALVGDSTQTVGLGYGIMLNAASGFTISNFGASGFVGEDVSLWDCFNCTVSGYSATGSPSVAIHRACYDISVITAGVTASGLTPYRVYAEQFTKASVTTTYSPAFTKFVDCHAFSSTTLAEAFDLGGAAYVNLTGCTGDGFNNTIGCGTRYSLPCYQVLSDVGAISGVTSLTVTAPIVNTGGTNTPDISLAGLTGLGTAGQVPTVNPGATALQWSTPAGGTTSVTAPITNSGTGQNPNIGLTSPLPVGNGGTGLTAPGASGNILTSNGSTWTSAAPSTATTYSSTVLADSPTVYYHFAESSGTSATDASGNGHTGTYVGTIIYGCSSLVHGVGDFSVGLNGSQYATCPVTPSGAAFTVELVVLATSVNPYGRFFATDIYSSSTGFLFSFQQNPATVPPTGLGITFNTTGTSLANVSITSGLAYVNARMHLALTYDSTTLKIYVNGGLAYSAVLNGTYKPSTNYSVLSIGADPTNADTMSGFMDEFALYPTALTQARIQAHVAAAAL